MTISTSKPIGNLSITTAFVETRRGGRQDVVTVIEETDIGRIIRGQKFGRGEEFETNAIQELWKQFPNAVLNIN